MKHINLSIILFAISFFGCSTNTDPQQFDKKFNKYVNKILGYHIVGQEETWGRQGIALINVYEDAITFNDNDSATIGFIGFGYGNDDLSTYYITKPNVGSWLINNNRILIQINDSTSYFWEILDIDNGFIIFEELSTDNIFSMMVMN